MNIRHTFGTVTAEADGEVRLPDSTAVDYGDLNKRPSHFPRVEMRGHQRYELVSDLYRYSPSNGRPLRICVVIDDGCLERAIASIVHEICRSNFIRVEFVLRVERLTDAGRRWGRLRKRFPERSTARFLFWKLYEGIDRACQSDLLDPRGKEPEELHWPGSHPQTIRIPAHGSEQTWSRVRATMKVEDLDLVLQLVSPGNPCVQPLRGKCGLWSLDYGSYDRYHEGLPYFWELYQRNSLSALRLLQTEADREPRVLAEALLATEMGLSVRRNAMRPLWASSQIVMQKLWELHVHGWAFVKSRAPLVPHCEKKRNCHVPSNLRLLRWFVPGVAGKVVKRVVHAVYNPPQMPTWQLGIRTGNSRLVGMNGGRNTVGFRWIISPNDHFYADPFLLGYQGRHWIFFEDYDYKLKQGHIACAALGENGEIGEVRTALKAEHHLSYPHTFVIDNSVYMIPESIAQRVVRLYRCTRFPDHWEPIADLFRGPAVDTSVYWHNGLWWFFTTLLDPRGHGIALYLFFAETLTGKWRYHPCNPISYDARNARCAGRIFEENGVLIRPSQNSTRRYGYSFALNEIVALSPEIYLERKIASIRPSSFGPFLGTHTYNREGPFEAIDVERTS